ncbi:putative Diaphanous, partial [Danaus plexippus plexippus]
MRASTNASLQQQAVARARELMSSFRPCLGH